MDRRVDPVFSSRVAFSPRSVSTEWLFAEEANSGLTLTDYMLGRLFESSIAFGKAAAAALARRQQ